MAQLINLGKLRFTYEGEYDNATEYSTNEVVKYGGNLYAYTSSTSTTGNLPTNGFYWTLMLQGITFEGNYDEEETYSQNDLVVYGGSTYIAKTTTTGNEPTDTNYWSIFASGIQYDGEYNISTDYQVGDIVNYGGIVYICIQDTVGNAPTNTTYWSILIEGISYQGVYSPSTEYNKNDIVTYDGSSWIALQNTTDNAPADPSVYWDLLAPGTFPSFAGNEGYFLSNNGTNVIWTEDLAANSLDIGQAFYVGTGAKEFALDEDENSEPLTNPVATFRFDNSSEDASFAQLAFQNADPTSSTDIIAYMDNGTDSSGWMGMGITGSNFDDTTYGITAPGDGYLFLETAGDPGDYTGNMVFATGTNGSENKLVFAAGGFDSGLTQMEITPGVNVHIEIPTPSTSPTTGALTVVGGVGVQGDMNIQGNVAIVGEITFGGEGTVVETSNLAVSDPTVFVGSNNIADTLDLGIIAEYAEDVVDQVTSINNKSLTNNVAELQTTAAHGYSVGDVVVVSGVDSTFNGTFVITATPTATTFRYAKTAANVTSAAVSPVGTATVTHERRYGGVVRDASDGVVKVFSGSTARPTGTVDFSNSGLVYAPIKAGAAEFISLGVGNITSAAGTIQLGGTVNITSAANFTGASVTLGSGTWSGAPTFSGNVVFSGNPNFSGAPTATTAAAGTNTTQIATTAYTTTAVNRLRYADRNTQSDSYTLVLTDDYRVIEMGKATAQTVTIPLDSSVNFPVGTQITVIQTGAGQVTIAGTGGVTVNATPGLKLRAQWSSATLIKRGTNLWVAIGDLTP